MTNKGCSNCKNIIEIDEFGYTGICQLTSDIVCIHDNYCKYWTSERENATVKEFLTVQKRAENAKNN